jgi:hypothetical protein
MEQGGTLTNSTLTVNVGNNTAPTIAQMQAEPCLKIALQRCNC